MMHSSNHQHAGQGSGDRLLTTLQRLLEITAVSLPDALNQAAQLLAETMAADKVDAFLYDAGIDSLVAIGVSDTPMGRKQRALGLDRLPLTNGGRTVEVFQKGVPHCSGDVEHDTRELPGVIHGLGIRSQMSVILQLSGIARGVLSVVSSQPEYFVERDLRFLEGVARWVASVGERAELTERLAAEAAAASRRVVAEELVTVLAHDLRNYLTPLKGRIDLIQRRARREQREDYLEDAEELWQSLRRLERLIADLLDVSRLEQGIFGLQVQPLDLVALVQETAARFTSPEHEVRLEAPVELVVRADPDRLRQLLENLLANALSHSPETAPVMVTIAPEQRADGQWAVLSVEDQGPGIPAELVLRLFTRFARGAGSTGLGLGLYLAHSIAEAHGGTLTVDTAAGTGTCFQCELPIADRRPLAPPEPPSGRSLTRILASGGPRGWEGSQPPLAGHRVSG
jgi:two-component system, OmpR family, sensor kinase